MRRSMRPMPLYGFLPPGCDQRRREIGADHAETGKCRAVQQGRGQAEQGDRAEKQKCDRCVSRLARCAAKRFWRSRACRERIFRPFSQRSLYIYVAVVNAAAFALARYRLWRMLALTALVLGALWVLAGTNPDLATVTALGAHVFHAMTGFALVTTFLVCDLIYGPRPTPNEIDHVSGIALSVYLLAALILVLVSRHDRSRSPLLPFSPSPPSVSPGARRPQLTPYR
jgi:hypothetical protein